MSVEYRYRRYEYGDAGAINQLYADITGSIRSAEQFAWQWLDAPGGNGEMWLIEAVGNNGREKLIGHHGLMPIRFTLGSHDFLFGKTENTMLLPEYRSKILYPRYERRFAEVYEQRFDALFSTFGDTAAIRQRRAMGYAFPARWLRFRMPTSWSGDLLFTCRALLSRLGIRAENWRTAGRVPSIELRRQPSKPPLQLRAVSSVEAPHDSFFDSFWPSIRNGYGLTPRRDKEDLNWRFWSNPYKSYITLVSDSSAGETGYVILSISESPSPTAYIDDIVPGKPDAERFGRLLDSALSWLRVNGIRWAELTTTSDSCADGSIASGLPARELLLLRKFAVSDAHQERLMPRKITAAGQSKNLDVDNWYVTPIVFEGR